MRKIVLLTIGSLMNHDFEILEIGNYKKNKIKFEIWNFSFFDNLYLQCKPKIECEKILSNFEDFRKLLFYNKNFNTLYDVRVNFSLSALKIFYYLSVYNCKFILHIGLQEENYQNKKFNFMKKIKSFFSMKVFLFAKSKIEYLFFKLNFYKLFSLKKADFVYVMGKQALYYINNHPLIGINTQIIKGHHRNHDRYLIFKKKNKLKKVNFSFAVFIDQAIPLHPDLVRLKLNDVKIDEYYNSLNLFFLKIQKEFNIKVKISIHPRIDAENIKKYFKTFDVTQGKTMELIFQSKFVITHNSTSANLAIFLKKPVICIINNSLTNSAHDHLYSIENLANKLNKKVVNIDQFDDAKLKKELCVDKKLYNRYLTNYYKLNSTNLTYSNILIKILN